MDVFSSYPIYRLDWTVQLAAYPIMVVEVGLAFISWSGATSVTSWRIYEGLDASTVKPTDIFANAGFETKVRRSNSTNFVQVGALLGFGDMVLRNTSMVLVS
jgi:hypothetical protein